MTSPSVFISYSHDSDAHGERVRGLGASLSRDGCRCLIDVYKDTDDDWPAWMTRQLLENDFVLCVVTTTYERRFRDNELPDRGHGVGWEAALIRRLLYARKLHNDRIFPVVFAESDAASVPLELIGFDTFRLFEPDGYETLLRKLLKRPAFVAPALGTAPDLRSRQPEPHFARPDAAVSAEAAKLTSRRRTPLTLLALVVLVALGLGLYQWRTLTPDASENSTPGNPAVAADTSGQSHSDPSGRPSTVVRGTAGPRGSGVAPASASPETRTSRSDPSSPAPAVASSRGGPAADQNAAASDAPQTGAPSTASPRQSGPSGLIRIHEGGDARLTAGACERVNANIVCPLTYTLDGGRAREVVAETERAWRRVRVLDNFGEERKRVDTYFLSGRKTRLQKTAVTVGEPVELVFELDGGGAGVTELTIVGVNPPRPDNPFYSDEAQRITHVPVSGSVAAAAWSGPLSHRPHPAVPGAIRYVGSGDTQLVAHPCIRAAGTLKCPFTYLVRQGILREIDAQTERTWSRIHVRDNFREESSRLDTYFVSRRGTRLDHAILGAGDSIVLVFELKLADDVSSLSIQALNPNPPDNAFYDRSTLTIPNVPIEE